MSNFKIVCRASSAHQSFTAVAHVTQRWLVNHRGEFQECTQECVETTHSPDQDDLYTCAVCGSECTVQTGINPEGEAKC